MEKKEKYYRLFYNISNALEFERATLLWNKNNLPECAQNVLNEENPNDEYWNYLINQFELKQKKRNANTKKFNIKGTKINISQFSIEKHGHVWVVTAVVTFDNSPSHWIFARNLIKGTRKLDRNRPPSDFPLDNILRECDIKIEEFYEVIDEMLAV